MSLKYDPRFLIINKCFTNMGSNDYLAHNKRQVVIWGKYIIDGWRNMFHPVLMSWNI